MAVELDWPNWPGFAPVAVARLETYPWPGNVRELRNVVERAVYRHEDPERQVEQLQFDPFHSPWAPTTTPVAERPDEPSFSGEEAAPGEQAMAEVQSGTPVSTSDFRGAVANYERALLEDALARNRFNQRATATALGLSYDQLRHALKRHKLHDSAA